MAFCSACGAQVDQAAFCPKCGAPQSPTMGSPRNTAAPASGGMAENVAGTLCYLVGWITGIIFLLIDKRPYVQFHAAQSIVVFGGLQVISIILGVMLGVGFATGGFHFAGPSFLLIHFVHLVSFVMWILLMIKAYQGELFKVPIASEVAEGIVGKPRV